MRRTLPTPVLVLLPALVALLLTGCDGSGGDDRPDEPGTSAPTAGSASASPSPLSVSLVDCDELIAALNADIVPMLVSDSEEAGDLELTRDSDSSLGCAATNPLGDELAVLELTLDPADEGCVSGDQKIPEAGPGSYACAATFDGSQFLVGAVRPAGRPESVNATLELASPRYDDRELAPVAATLTRTLLGLVDEK